MAYVIDGDKCVACGNCVESCPQKAICELEHFIIKAKECISCGACASECPVDAIYRDDNVKDWFDYSH